MIVQNCTNQDWTRKLLFHIAVSCRRRFRYFPNCRGFSAGCQRVHFSTMNEWLFVFVFVFVHSNVSIQLSTLGGWMEPWLNLLSCPPWTIPTFLSLCNNATATLCRWDAFSRVIGLLPILLVLARRKIALACNLQCKCHFTENLAKLHPRSSQLHCTYEAER